MVAKCRDCSRQARYGIKGTKVAEFCSNHKTQEMCDVKSKKCLECDK